MKTVSIDPVRFKTAQRQQWDSAASGWHKWWETIESGAQHVSDRLVELADIQPGHRVLDIATGIGEPAVTAARRVGSLGHVMATDYSTGMLQIAEERAAELGLKNLEFRVLDAEELDYPENSFDAALSRWGLMLLPNPGEALNRVHRTLVPKGMFAASVWDIPQKVPLGSVPMGVIGKMLELPPPPKEAPGLFSMSDPGMLEDAFTRAGFDNVRVEPISMMLELPSAKSFVDLIQDTASVITATLADQPAARQADVWQAIEDAARQQYGQPDGSIRMLNHAINVVGRKNGFVAG